MPSMFRVNKAIATNIEGIRNRVVGESFLLKKNNAKITCKMAPLEKVKINPIARIIKIFYLLRKPSNSIKLMGLPTYDLDLLGLIR